jgi:putative DNA methylase
MKERRGVRRLIETDEMPIGVISEHSRKDQNVRKGHLHTLHVWWATRPLASCRAVLMATILPDPADENCPEDFRREAQETLKDFNWRSPSDPLGLRKALLEFIAHFAAWENSNNPNYVKTARRLVRAAHPDGPPLVVDPFAGIGSIPFEALRIGADAFAGDLNPVAVLLNKVALEYLPTYGQGGQGRPPLHEAVRKWGEWVRERAIEELRPFYPLEPDGSEPLAYLWARTIRCEGPGCGAEVPLVGLLWLSRKEKHRVALRYRGDRARKEVVFEIFEPKSESEVQPPIVKRFSATCPVCGYTTPYARVREQIRARQGGTRDARLIAVITLRQDGSRGFRLATDQDVAVARRAAEELARREREHQGPLPLVPDEPFPDWYSGVFNPGLWNIKTWGDLFTPRQALALCTFVRLVREAHGQVLQETGDAGFARAVTTCLAVAVSNWCSTLAPISFYTFDHDANAFVKAAAFPCVPTSPRPTL